MFKSLRKKLMLAHMLLISLLMMVSFLGIYSITFYFTHQGIQKDLSRLLILNEQPQIRHFREVTLSLPVLQNQQSAFVMRLSTEGNHMIYSSFSEESKSMDYYQRLVIEALNKNRRTHYVKLDDQIWAFQSKENQRGVQMAFLDVTNHKNILSRLAYTLLMISALMLGGIFTISNYLTKKALKPIEKSFEKQNQFIADASHELKTPLAVMVSNIDVLMSQEQDEFNQKWLAYIKHEADRLSHLTNRLLQAAQTTENLSRAKKWNPIPISEILEENVLAYEAIAYEHQLKILSKIEKDLYIWGNSDEIRQIFVILLDNAVKYAQKGTPIEIKCYGQPNDVVISFYNECDRIPEDKIEKLFDRFYRGDDSRDRRDGHYGLGLSIAKMLVEAHQGVIKCENRSKGILLTLVLRKKQGSS